MQDYPMFPYLKYFQANEPSFVTIAKPLSNIDEQKDF